MRVLVTGGTGTVGSRVVRRLVDRKIPVSALTSSPEKRDRVPPEAQAVVGDLLERPSLARALEGVDRLFLLTPLHPEETRMGLNAVAAAAEAGVERVVFMSIYGAERGDHLPHFRAKVDIARALEESGVAAVVLRANSFFQNDLFATKAIAERGVFLEPFGALGVQRVDARDIADVAVEALLRDELDGDVPVNGPAPLTSEDCAAVWSAALGREVRPAGGVEAWRRAMEPHLPGWLADDLEGMYRLFQEGGSVAREEDMERQRAVLGRDPRPYEDFVREAAEGLV